MIHDRSSASSLFRRLAALASALTLAACGGNVIVEDPPSTTTTEPEPSPICEVGESLCGDECTDTSSDPQNCGNCGIVCVDGFCDGGFCQSQPQPVCPDGYSPCGDFCYDLQNDPQNCGFCGNVCSPGVSCSGGSCAAQSCVGCGEFITTGEPVELCPGSDKLYDVLVNCLCVDKCVFQCSDNACAGMEVTQACQDCVLDAENGCGNEFNECANDI